MRKLTPISQRLEAKVIKTDDCWLWQGAKNPNGYGQIWDMDAGRLRLVHRVSYEQEHGPVADEACVLHRCDVPACVRPSHLFLGTKKDNTQDMIAKGRSRMGVSLPGESNLAARLNAVQVGEIRTLHSGGLAIRACARRYGVSQRTIQRIVRGTHWQEIR